MTVVVEQSLNLARYGRHDGTVEQRIQTGEQESADNDGDQDLDAGIDLAFRLLVGDEGLCGNDSGVSLVADGVEKLSHSSFTSFFLF